MCGKYCRDEESSDMLDIIFNEKRFDLGFLYGLSSTFENAVIYGVTDKNYVFEDLEKRRIKNETAINKMNSTFLEFGWYQ